MEMESRFLNTEVGKEILINCWSLIRHSAVRKYIN